MDHPISEDELLQRLESEGGASDPTVSGFLTELDTLIADVRPSAKLDPCSAEPELSLVMAQLRQLANSTVDNNSVDAKADVDAPPPPAIMLGQYELLSELGSGGMGTVFKARHTRLDRLVALKVLPPGRVPSQQMLARFNREMRAAGKLHHPHIVSTHDAGEANETHFLVMELVDGFDLSALVKNIGPLSVPDACELIRQAALGLQQIADHGMVHRDIKPSNLMLARPSKPGEPPLVKILDLGLALFQSGHAGPANELTETGQVIGTIDYMAPEQGLETPHQLDIRADLYSLGATLFKLLTGRAPFEGEKYNTTMKRLRALDRETPPALNDLRPDCPEELAAIVARLLAKSPSERPAKPADVALALARFAKGSNLAILLKQAPPSNSMQSAEALSKTFTPPDTAPDYKTKDRAELTTTTTPNKHLPTANRTSNYRHWSIWGGLCAAVLLLAVIVIQTDKGSLQIEAPDDLLDQMTLSVLRNGTPDGTKFEIKPGAPAQEHRIRSGRIEVRLPADQADEFDLQPHGELVIRRGKTAIIRLTRRTPEPKGEPGPAMTGTALAPPIEILDPPPLDEWLKGRTILTVAQDGSGQFQTIQAALNALQPGQAVQVLDKGPYRERLKVELLPKDTGLFNVSNTVLELPEWKLVDEVDGNNQPKTTYRGHILKHADGFRLHGFECRFPQTTYEDGQRITSPFARDLTVENCCFRASEKVYGEAIDLGNWGDTASSGIRVTVRDCVIEGSLAIGAWVGYGTAVVERNYFVPKSSRWRLMFWGQNLKQLRLRHNVFSADSTTEQDVMLTHFNRVDGLEITNNCFAAPHALWFTTTLPEGAVRVLNNLHYQPGFFLYAVEGTKQIRLRGTDRWHVDHNAFQIPLEAKSNPGIVPTRAGNYDFIPRLLSKIPQDPNYLRIDPNDPLANSGAGGDWPSYIGALPPGPAPKDGDWFTKLRERWGDVNLKEPTEPKEMSGPIKIEEPPPLEEWLKGRTILTVAQDGSGQFKTIQAALDAVQAGQVVNVLDQGPYYERLELQSPPADIGLISEVQTRIEFTEFRPGGDDAQGWGHYFKRADRLRIHGLEFQIPQVPANQVTIGIYISEPRGVVFENCAVRRKNSPESQSLTFGDIKGNLDEPTVIRECFTEQGMQIYALHPLNSLPPTGSALVTRNYITGELHGLMAGGTFHHCVIRNNIFAGALKFPFIQNVVQADWFELSNNTFFTIPAAVRMDSLAAQWLHERSISGLKGEKNPPPAPDRGHAPSGQGAIYNNLHNRPGFLNVTGGAEDEPWTWQIGFNCYPGDGDIPAKNAIARDTNIIASPIFYSIVPHDRDYARLKPDSPGSTSIAGGKWPNFTGALPPGPTPQNGDWFTKLQGRWGDLKPAEPIKVSGPIQINEPPLDD